MEDYANNNEEYYYLEKDLFDGLENDDPIFSGSLPRFFPAR